MSDAAEIEHALSVLRGGPVPLGSNAETIEQRERLLPALRATVQRTPAMLRRRALIRRAEVVIGAGALSTAAAVFALSRPAPIEMLKHDAELVHVEGLDGSTISWVDTDERLRRVSGDASVPARGTLSVDGVSGAELTTSRGVQVELGEHTDVGLGELEVDAGRSSLRLVHGSVRCRVPRLGPSHQFSVVTPDARIVVHGTVFSVRRDEGAEENTCVRVEEGVVSVQHRNGEVELTSGSSWGCTADQTAASERAFEQGTADGRAEPIGVADLEPETAVLPQEVQRRSSRKAVKMDGTRPLVAKPPTGTLAKENQLLHEALRSERAGDVRRARSLFSRLSKEYPASPLVPEARSGLARLQQAE
jgi:ferric-dicitrate binding protein FerR (iron transport regulator)